MSVKDFLDYVKESKSKNTYKEYEGGIRKFCEWYGKKHFSNGVIPYKKR